MFKQLEACRRACGIRGFPARSSDVDIVIASFRAGRTDLWADVLGVGMAQRTFVNGQWTAWHKLPYGTVLQGQLGGVTCVDAARDD